MRFDRLTIAGLVCGAVALFGAQWIEGGRLAALVQGPAALIVFVGTFGATLASTGAGAFRSATRLLREVFVATPDRRRALPAQYRDLALLARKEGLVSLDRRERTMATPFMRRALRHVIDGCDEEQLRRILAADLDARLLEREAGARVFETAGGYAPTMGILGAVLGLVHAMEALSDPSALGEGIAVAFIATIYGVGIANLVLLPIAEKIRCRTDAARLEDEMVIEGTLALQAGGAPRMIERELRAHLEGEGA